VCFIRMFHMAVLVAQRLPKTNPASADTRQRLIDVAAALFADQGFEHVTVREICRDANANVAAVNYHFGDKAGLYRAVIAQAIAVMQETNELTQRAGEGLSHEDRLREFVRIFMSRLTNDGPTSWVHRLMAREMEHPTEALDQVMTQVIGPRMAYLGAIAGAIMGLPPTEIRVMRCIGNLQMLCLVMARKPPASVEKQFAGGFDLEATIHHIAEFSLGGMRAIAAGVP